MLQFSDIPDSERVRAWLFFTVRFRITVDEEMASRPMFTLDEDLAAEIEQECRSIAASRLTADEGIEEPTEADIDEYLEKTEPGLLKGELYYSNKQQVFVSDFAGNTLRTGAYKLNLEAAGEEIDASRLDLATLFYDWESATHEDLYDKLRAADLLAVYAASLGRDQLLGISDAEGAGGGNIDEEAGGLEDSVRERLAESGGGECEIDLTWSITGNWHPDALSELQNCQIDTKHPKLQFLGSEVTIDRF